MPHVSALDDKIDELAELVRDRYGLAELNDPSASTEVGRLSPPAFFSC